MAAPERAHVLQCNTKIDPTGNRSQSKTKSPESDSPSSGAWPWAPAPTIAASSTDHVTQEWLEHQDPSGRSSMPRYGDEDKRTLDTRFGAANRSRKNEFVRSEVQTPPCPTPSKTVWILPDLSDVQVERDRTIPRPISLGHYTKNTTIRTPGQRLTGEVRPGVTRAQRRALTHPTAKIQQAPVRRASPQDHEVKKALFACPYFKFNPQRHRDCQRYELRRVKDVRQHLARKHRHSASCLRCGRSFDSQESLIFHRLDVLPCEAGDQGLTQTQPRGVSQEQWDKITQRKPLNKQNKQKSAEEQWADIWQILFPGITPPTSVYLSSSQLEESLSCLRACWVAKAPEITSKAMRQTGPFPEDRSDLAVGTFLRQFVECIFNQFEAETTEPSSNASPQNNSSPPPASRHLPQAEWDDSSSTASTARERPFIATPWEDDWMGYVPDEPFSWSPNRDRSPLHEYSTTTIPSKETDDALGASLPYEDWVPGGAGGQDWLDEAVSPEMLAASTEMQQGQSMSESLLPVLNRHTWHESIEPGLEFN